MAWGDPKRMGLKNATLFELAHEYGHRIEDANHIQAPDDQPTRDERLANCYAGIFIFRKYPGSMNDIVTALERHGVKDDNHGTAKQGADALRQGATGDRRPELFAGK